MGWRTDDATRLPVTSALGVHARRRQSAMGDGEMLLEGEAEGSALAPGHADSGFGCCWRLTLSPDLLVIENGFLWDSSSDSVLKAT